VGETNGRTPSLSIAALRQAHDALEESRTNHSFGESCSRHASTLPKTTPTLSSHPPTQNLRIMHSPIRRCDGCLCEHPFFANMLHCRRTVSLRPRDNPRSP
jgi:hypothetical protein